MLPREPDCIFCKIASGEMKADVVLEDERIVAFRDINPMAPLHVVVIPREHIETIAHTDDEGLAGHIAITAAKIARREGYGESGFRLVANSGPDAGMGVAHLHFHVLGGRHMTWPPG